MGKKATELYKNKKLASIFIKLGGHNMVCKSISRYTSKFWPGFYLIN
jgi:hypothetical protein